MYMFSQLRQKTQIYFFQGTYRRSHITIFNYFFTGNILKTSLFSSSNVIFPPETHFGARSKHMFSQILAMVLRNTEVFFQGSYLRSHSTNFNYFFTHNILQASLLNTTNDNLPTQIHHGAGQEDMYMFSQLRRKTEILFSKEHITAHTAPFSIIFSLVTSSKLVYSVSQMLSFPQKSILVHGQNTCFHKYQLW